MADAELRLVCPRVASFFAARWSLRTRSSRDVRTIPRFWNGIRAALPTIAALTPEGFEVDILGENMESVDFDRDIIGITAMTQQATRAHEVERGVLIAYKGIHKPESNARRAQYCRKVCAEIVGRS